MSYMGKAKSQGFTLIEIMVVVVILGILASIVVPRIMSRPDEARIVKAQQDIRAISAALDLYRLDNFKYPTTDQGLEALVQRPIDLNQGAKWREGGYLAKLPNDPWGSPYNYLIPGQNAEYDLYSLGADGVLGGEAANGDIGNWSIE
jgi:general secretion pathway protein G